MYGGIIHDKDLILSLDDLEDDIVGINRNLTLFRPLLQDSLALRLFGKRERYLNAKSSFFTLLYTVVREIECWKLPRNSFMVMVGFEARISLKSSLSESLRMVLSTGAGIILSVR